MSFWAVAATVTPHKAMIEQGQASMSAPVAAKDCGMKGASEPMLRRKLRSYSLALGAIAALTAGTVQAQNIDQGKSATKLFADTCATCHHNPRGLAKGRFRLTLYMFLQQHYAANSSSAWALTSYLESVDTPQRSRSKSGAAKPHGPARSSVRPPAPVPQR
jgi:mono/diheme cytochrome c family protein